ncbi:MAG: hypothetical protein AB1508_02705 [Pseudomonadota bacterium]
MEEGSEPHLSLVIPTTGGDDGVTRLLRSLINGGSPDMLSKTQLVVYLNRLSHIRADLDKIRTYLELIRPHFKEVQFHVSEVHHLTAEESACAAIEKATGRYLWIAGDKRIFLPEGLQQLARFLAEGDAPCAYFNSVWQDRDGFTNAICSSHFMRREFEMPYKLLVQKLGANYMATAMGTWVFHRQFLDVALWKHLIKTCGPHFSHVFALLATIGEVPTKCYSVFLSIIEAKPYHSGDFREWIKYSELAKTYRYFAWSLGMARLYNYVIGKGRFSYLDLRRSVCVEGRHFGRQVDEIYIHLLAQIKLGWENERERLTLDEFQEIHTLLVQTCPERTVVNGLLEKLYSRTRSEPPKDIEDVTRPIQQAIILDQTGVPFASLIIGQVADKFIRLHPQGYVLSHVEDHEGFKKAYYLLDPPIVHESWEILDDEQIFESNLFNKSTKSMALFPHRVDRNLIEKPIFKPVSVRLEFELAKFLSTIGQKSLGNKLWNHAVRRGSRRPN